MISEQLKKNFYQNFILNFDALKPMTKIIEECDSSTVSHSFHVSEYVRMMLEYIKNNRLYPHIVSDDYVENIKFVSIFHDVGKIKIPDEILNKAGKFTKEEYEIMKTHTTEGKNIMKKVFPGPENSTLLKYAEDIVLYHHEKWDGSGYPTGISKEDIPLCARIMAVADVFDALVSKRVYKEKMSVDEAYNVLKEESGKHFDPQIVDIFINIRYDVEEYVKKTEEGI